MRDTVAEGGFRTLPQALVDLAESLLRNNSALVSVADLWDMAEMLPDGILRPWE